ncbi:MAG: sugar transferase [Bacteroides sp.]|nr:sugar transferase [Bacteroides sp.]
MEKELPLMFADRPSGSVAVEEKSKKAVSSVAVVSSPVRTKIAEKPVYDFIKRIFDVISSFLGLVVLSPIFLVISLMITFERSGKGVFFKQKRLGKNGRYIYVYKFRSMINDAENVERWLNKKQISQYYREYKVGDDPRVTKVGKMLRRTGLDELPQLINILKGELSLVGPRPIQETEAELYGEDKDLLLSVNPGLTGYWQVYCSGDVTYSNKKRQKMELYYVRHRSLGWDIKLCFATVGAIVRKAKRGQ